MLSFLKNHPFGVEAFFESTIILTFAVPKKGLEKFIPACMALDVFEDKWAFVAIAMVQTKDLRPKGFPKILGNNFFLIGYRVFVKYIDIRGKRLRGLYILKSETDKRKMEFLGNIFTNYNYQTIDISRTHEEQGVVTVKSVDSGFYVRLKFVDEEISLPEFSPFPNWKIARRYAGPLPFTFNYRKEKKEVLIIQGVREDWNPAPVQVLDFDISFFKKMGLQRVVLANAFAIHNIPYYWKKGKIEKWNP